MRFVTLFFSSMFALLLSSPAFALVSLHGGGMVVTLGKVHVSLLVFGLVLLTGVFTYRYLKAK